MGGEWRKTTLDQIGRIVTGKTPPSSRHDCFGGDIPFVTPSDLNGRRMIESTERCLTEIGEDLLKGILIPAGAVMVSCIGSDMGKAAVANRVCVTNQQINSIIVDSNNDALFVYYNLSERKSEFRAAAGGSAIPILNKTEFGRMSIVLPPLEEQSVIAHILGTLDDKIELNRRVNEILEVMTRALFKSWFIDFDPVRSKAKGCDTGLPKKISDLFPDRFEESDLGEIPEGWPARHLNEVLTEKNNRVGEARITEYSSTNDGLQLRSDRFKKQLSASNANNKMIQQGDLVFGLSRQVLNFGLMRDTIGCVSPAYKVFEIDKDMIVPDLLERMIRMRSRYFHNAISASSREGQSISNEGLGLLNFVQPEVATQNAFYFITDPFRARVKSLLSESRSLEALRDKLLPKLVSGELRIKDVKKFIGRKI